MLHRSWIEIDLHQIVENYKIYRDSMPCGQDITGVVKANAYGHGDVQVALALQNEGCSSFAVSNIGEAVKIREAGITGRILILGYTPVSEAEKLEKYQISQALISEEYAKALSETGYKIKAQFAIDTGMNRIGLDADNPDEAECIIRKYSHLFELEGIFTHMAVADSFSRKDEEFTHSQTDKFFKLAQRINDLKLPYIHYMNSAAGLNYNCEQKESSPRLGIILYGLSPDPDTKLPKGIKPAMVWKSEVAMVKTVRAGEYIGYGCTAKPRKDIQLATIPTGYADGYPRILSNKGYVLINGCKAPITGRICMDQMMVDVSKVKGVSRGTEVILIGESGKYSLNANELGKMAGTIGHEILCGISPRVARVYKGI